MTLVPRLLRRCSPRGKHAVEFSAFKNEWTATIQRHLCIYDVAKFDTKRRHNTASSRSWGSSSWRRCSLFFSPVRGGQEHPRGIWYLISELTSPPNASCSKAPGLEGTQVVLSNIILFVTFIRRTLIHRLEIRSTDDLHPHTTHSVNKKAVGHRVHVVRASAAFYSVQTALDGADRHQLPVYSGTLCAARARLK